MNFLELMTVIVKQCPKEISVRECFNRSGAVIIRRRGQTVMSVYLDESLHCVWSVRELHKGNWTEVECLKIIDISDPKQFDIDKFTAWLIKTAKTAEPIGQNSHLAGWPI